MNKSEAIKLAVDKFDLNPKSESIHFSSVNKTKPVWWFEIPLAKIVSTSVQEINLITESSGVINLLKIPTDYFNKDLGGFKIRDSVQRLCLELDITTFQNKVGSAQSSFKQFVQK